MSRRWTGIVIAIVPLGLGLGLGAQRVLYARGLSFAEFANELRQGDEPRFAWRSVDGKHWQVTSAAPDNGAPVADAVEPSAGCAPGMVRVRGAFRRESQAGVTGEIERLQDAACTDWISREFPARCRTYDAEKIARDLERFPTQAMDYCIDRFEYPNSPGEYPVIVVTFREAAALCAKADKRLCTEDEWTFACEGEETRPYPYGWTRDDTACVMDRPWRAFAEGALQPRNGDQARKELDRLWQGEASGTRPACRSPFGVYDMTGNVDEWTTSVNRTGYRSILKGGYWGPVRARCRPSTRAHGEDFVAYQQGFRCCADPSAEPSVEPAPPADLSDAGADTDAGAPELAPTTTDDLIAEWPETDDDIEAITRSRAIRCAGAPTSDVPAGAAPIFAMILATSAAAFARRFARARRSAPDA